MTVFCLFFILARCASFVSWCGSKDYCAVTFLFQLAGRLVANTLMGLVVVAVFFV